MKTLVIEYKSIKSKITINILTDKEAKKEMADNEWGLCLIENDVNPVIMVRKNKSRLSIPIISHELIHALYDILQTKNINPLDSDGELMAYSLEYALYEVAKFCKAKHIALSFEEG